MALACAPAMGAWMIGNSMPSRSVSLVIIFRLVAQLRSKHSSASHTRRGR
jgi:hypothetical protein